MGKEAYPGRAFSHNMQGPIPPALDLDSFPKAKEAIRVTEEFCDNYRALRKEVEILQEENCRLRRMLEIFLDPPSSSSSNNPLETLVQTCRAEKLKLKELIKLKDAPSSPPKE